MTFLPTPVRLSALAICTTAIVSLAAQFTVSQGLMGDASIVETLWRMAGYFTILTNLGGTGVMAVAVAGRAPSARISGVMTGFWPWPFLDADAFGGAAFAALGLGLIALARWLVR